jgi:hypothetical protein
MRAEFLMAGPLSSEEIEDVVSSVRRLVSNEERSRTLSRDLNVDRLLLTPALRVVPETSPLAPLVLETPVVEASGATASPVPAEDADDIALAAALSADTPVALAGSEDATAATDLDTGTTVEAEIETSWDEDIWAAAGTVEPATDDAPIDDEPDVAAAEAPDAGEAADSTGETWEDAETEWSDSAPVPFVPLRRRAEHLAARVAAGEVMEAAPSAPETPDADVELASDGEALPGPEDQVVAAAQSTFEIAQAVEAEHMATEFLDADGTPLSVLDETALHEIVRQMIRAELQGELGERITRNVRKLVRAEINRALIARDLD